MTLFILIISAFGNDDFSIVFVLFSSLMPKASFGSISKDCILLTSRPYSVTSSFWGIVPSPTTNVIGCLSKVDSNTNPLSFDIE